MRYLWLFDSKQDSLLLSVFGFEGMPLKRIEPNDQRAGLLSKSTIRKTFGRD
jgi:hypothetical protein